MADKKIKLVVNEQEVTCNFGVNYFYKHFQEATGKDLLVDGLNDVGTTKMFDIVPALYYAAYRAEQSLTKQDPNLTKDLFEHFVLSGDEALVIKLWKDYLALITPEQSGEAVAQTESL